MLNFPRRPPRTPHKGHAKVQTTAPGFRFNMRASLQPAQAKSLETRIVARHALRTPPTARRYFNEPQERTLEAAPPTVQGGRLPTPGTHRVVHSPSYNPRAAQRAFLQRPDWRPISADAFGLPEEEPNNAKLGLSRHDPSSRISRARVATTQRQTRAHPQHPSAGLQKSSGDSSSWAWGGVAKGLGHAKTAREAGTAGVAPSTVHRTPGALLHFHGAAAKRDALGKLTTGLVMQIPTSVPGAHSARAVVQTNTNLALEPTGSRLHARGAPMGGAAGSSMQTRGGRGLQWVGQVALVLPTGVPPSGPPAAGHIPQPPASSRKALVNESWLARESIDSVGEWSQRKTEELDLAMHNVTLWGRTAPLDQGP